MTPRPCIPIHRETRAEHWRDLEGMPFLRVWDPARLRLWIRIWDPLGGWRCGSAWRPGEVLREGAARWGR